MLRWAGVWHISRTDPRLPPSIHPTPRSIDVAARGDGGAAAVHAGPDPDARGQGAAVADRCVLVGLGACVGRWVGRWKLVRSEWSVCVTPNASEQPPTKYPSNPPNTTPHSPPPPHSHTAIVRADKARAVEDMLLGAATSGRLPGKVGSMSRLRVWGGWFGGLRLMDVLSCLYTEPIKSISRPTDGRDHHHFIQVTN